MEITKGKWDIWQNSDESYAIIVDDFYKGEMLEKNDAILIADAGNTYQETNKLPSELAEANKELFEALRLCVEDFFNGNINNNPSTDTRTKAIDTIKKHSHA